MEIIQNKELKQHEKQHQVSIFHFQYSFLCFSIVHTDEYQHEPRVRRSSIVVREHQLSQYPINYDPSPHIIRKKVDDQREHVVYKQQIAVRYLCPPTPPPPPPLIIREIRPAEPCPLPPSSFNEIVFFSSFYFFSSVIIRQRPPAPVTPPPIIIRERPPTPPSYTTPQVRQILT